MHSTSTKTIIETSWEYFSILIYGRKRKQKQLSFDAFFSSFPLAESPPRDLQITAYK